MKIRYLRLAGICSACLAAACALAQGWPQRYTNSGDDIGKMVAVDHRGNVFVGGTVTYVSGGVTKTKFGVIKYDAGGSFIWSKFWQDSGIGVDVATSIAVDMNGAVYLAGVSHIGGGGVSGDPISAKYAVVKWNADNSMPWPVSGSGTGCTFDGGAAVVTSAAGAAVIGNHGQYHCAMSIENVATAQPTFAIKGPSGPSSVGRTLWETVVFDFNATNGIEVEPGWPIEQFGGDIDEPMDIAISPSDNTVYVTGTTFDDNRNKYTTVRYPASGTTSGAPYYIWIDYLTDGSNTFKEAEGRAIAVDYSTGIAYVTGVVVNGSGLDTEYATRAIAKLPSAGRVSDPIWTSPFNPTSGDDQGTGISLSFEAVGAPAAMVPYVYVTGLSTNSGSYDIATLRYDSSNGNPLWTTTDHADHYAAGIASANGYLELYWPHVLGAGQGNCYVVGSKINSSYYDYLLHALTKSDTSRFDATFNNADDESNWCATGGAGLMYFTGQSANSGTTNYDFLTASHAETATSAYPSYMEEWKGVIMWPPPPPPPSELDSVDGVYHALTSALYGGIKQAELYTETTVSTTATELSLKIVGHVSSAGVREKVEIYNRVTASWQLFSDQPIGTSDVTTIIQIKDDPKEYIDPSTGVVKVAVTYYGGSGAGYWTGYWDQVLWSTIN